MDRNSKTHEIVVLGGGYAGMMATARLARRCRRLPVRITLVNPSAWFVERLRTHQLAAGHELRAHRIAWPLPRASRRTRRDWSSPTARCGR